MASEGIAELLRGLTEGPTRRGIVRTLAGLGLGGALAQLGLAGSEAKKKRKKKKKCKGGKTKCSRTCCAPGEACLGGRCCPGAQTCGGVCCADGAACFDGSCCPADRACGTLCCAPTQVCADPESGICVVGQGTCSAGASTCGSVEPIFCNGTGLGDPINCACFQSTSGITRCARPIDEITTNDCGHCENDADCEQLFPNILGVFCGANAIGICQCDAGENLCAAPCPVV